ncbi:MAG TPA: phosphoglycerate kinase [Solirubrobacteraceae bacterium]|nr:phosphoglycerate kinase [Solirubrobacteraceae bacterium]
MRTLDDLGDIEGKRALVRVDFNVPVSDGHVRDDSRMRGSMPTLEELRERGAKLLLVTHFGRPEGRDEEFSLKPIAKRTSELLGTDVELAEDLDHVPDDRDVVMLENIRFEEGETKNDEELAKRLASLADVYVNDAFGTAHRAHASTEGVVRHVERAAAGRLFQREVETIRDIMNDPERPFLAIMGGAKVTEKIGVIETFLELADVVLLGGAMATPFLAVLGHDIAESICEDEGLEPARKALEKDGYPNGKLRLPVDLVIADSFSGDAEVQIIQGVDVPDGWMQLDIGSKTRTAYVAEIRKAKTIFWNGPIGAFEHKQFAAGSLAIAQAMAQTESKTVVGGGDSGAALKEMGLAASVTHLSTGGGASLQLIEGAKLPGLDVLSD